mmetsp:Transcript_129428/g.360511  ORF Transcript_129428/g.360511 Transcript_129428/m.360511 type:complete len:227 (+) Transcript_129428:49-729(+)
MPLGQQFTSSVMVPVGDQEEEVLVDSRAGPASDQLDGTAVMGPGTLCEIIRSGTRGHGKPWEHMTSTERKITLDIIARKNRGTRERNSGIAAKSRGTRGRSEGRGSSYELPEYLSGLAQASGEWRNWSRGECETWLKGQTDLEEVTEWNGPREEGNYTLPGQKKERKAAQGFSGELTEDTTGKEGYVPGTNVPTGFKYLVGHGIDHSQTYAGGGQSFSIDQGRDRR